jgi:Tfp pilus assembly protein PilF
METARRALELDPGDVTTHLAVGYANGFFGDPKIAEAEFEEALRLNPNSIDAIPAYAGFAATFGKAQEGAEAAERAMRLNPSYPTVDAHSFVFAFFMAGRPKDVLQAVTRLPEDEFFPGDYVYVAGSLAAKMRLKPPCSGRSPVFLHNSP